MIFSSFFGKIDENWLIGKYFKSAIYHYQKLLRKQEDEQ
jgi:hypothetical protein